MLFCLGGSGRRLVSADFIGKNNAQHSAYRRQSHEDEELFFSQSESNGLHIGISSFDSIRVYRLPRRESAK